MKTGDYRRDYAAYSAALERARYDYHAGIEPELRLAPLRDRYADLWTRAAVDDLERALEESPPQFETERVALAALLRAAQSGSVEARAGEVSDELARCKASARVSRPTMPRTQSPPRPTPHAAANSPRAGSTPCAPATTSAPPASTRCAKAHALSATTLISISCQESRKLTLRA